MHYTLIRSTRADAWDNPANTGYDEARIVARLQRLATGGDTYEIVGTSEMDDAERFSLYAAAAAGAPNRYKLRRVFGSNVHNGDELGRKVPALVVRAAAGDTRGDVYPHETANGVITTVASYLDETA